MRITVIIHILSWLLLLQPILKHRTRFKTYKRHGVYFCSVVFLTFYWRTNCRGRAESFIHWKADLSLWLCRRRGDKVMWSAELLCENEKLCMFKHVCTHPQHSSSSASLLSFSLSEWGGDSLGLVITAINRPQHTSLINTHQHTESGSHWGSSYYIKIYCTALVSG